MRTCSLRILTSWLNSLNRSTYTIFGREHFTCEGGYVYIVSACLFRVNSSKSDLPHFLRIIYLVTDILAILTKFPLHFYRHLAWATLAYNMELLSVDRFTIEMTTSVFAKQVSPENTVEWVSLIFFCLLCTILTISFMHNINYIFNLKLIVLIVITLI